MRVSSIDIGSNAIRQLIAEIDLNGQLKIIKKHRENIRLGADVFTVGTIKPTTQKRLILAFKRMAQLSRKFKADKSLAYATSAFRDAENQKHVIRMIAKTSGIRIKVISGKTEAELIRKAVQLSIGLNNERCLLIDIGGGSIELTELHKNKILFSKSFKWGMVRMINEAIQNKTNAQNLLATKLKTESAHLPHKKFDLAIGTGGNLDAIAKLKLLVLKKGPNTLVTYNEIKKIHALFQNTPINQRANKFKLKPDRVDVLEPALYLTLQLMKKYQIKKLKIPGVGLKEGAILSLLN